MGVVFKAIDVPHDRIVALKFLRTDGAVDADLIARFKNEGHALRRGAASERRPDLRARPRRGRLYIVLEFVDGSNLDQLMVKGGGPFSVDRALSVDRGRGARARRKRTAWASSTAT